MIQVDRFIKAMEFEVLNPATGEELPIENSDINRPGMQLAGFWQYFAWERPQLFGKVELTYLRQLSPELREERLSQFVSYDIPCIIICHQIECDTLLLEKARQRGIAVFLSQKDTTQVVMEMITWLNKELAPSISRHGVLVDVHGVGVMITGESGVGKSEAALELVKRGHRLVADDVVDIKRVADTLVGDAPEMIRHFMEIRGVGIIDISTMYGIGAVVREKPIEMVVHLEHWRQGKEYDRMGLEDEYTDILGVQIPRLVIPVHPGRNLAVVLEVAARNLRLKQQGFSAARILTDRFNARLNQI
ncbi:MAG: HPr(Ser) kinase/phosphatase [Eubacteriales bacterium]|nr:HPr(Ser) kinase/phosphatase [Eubacteriales bacterium]